MRLRTVVPCLCLILAGAGCGAGTSPDSADAVAPPSVAPDLDAIAANVVRSARVEMDDVVMITGSVRDLELLENIVIEVQKAGGSALLSVGSERILRRSYDEVPEEYDTRVPQWGRIIASEVDVVISMDQAETPDLLAHVPPERVQARTRANSGMLSEMVRRGVRSVDIGNNLYPTHARAARFGITRDQLASHFWNGLATDPAQLLRLGRTYRPVLAAANEVRITHPNGTDLTLQLDTSAIFINDGAITDDDIAAGGANLLKYLPAGEIYARIRPETAQGRFVVDHYSFQGTDVPGLTIAVVDGEITGITAESNVEPLLAAYGNERDGRERLTVFDLGLNPAVPAPVGSRVLAFMPGGMVTLFTGDDSWAGGTNTAAFGLILFLSGATVTVDGTVIAEDGSLRL